MAFLSRIFICFFIGVFFLKQEQAHGISDFTEGLNQQEHTTEAHSQSIHEALNEKLKNYQPGAVITSLPSEPSALSEPIHTEALKIYFIGIQQALLGFIKDPIQQLKLLIFGNDRRETPLPLEITQIENDVLDLFAQPPEERDVKVFAQKWKISERKANEVLLYYGYFILDKVDPVEKNPANEETQRRLLSYSLLYFIKFYQDSTTQNYNYYRKSLTKKSVTEMAAELQIPEQKVYEQLAALSLSTSKSFDLPLRHYQKERLIHFLNKNNHSDLVAQLDLTLSIFETGKWLLTHGFSLVQISAALDIGEKAFENILHYRSDKRKFISWKRTARFEGQFYTEETVLKILMNRNFSIEEITKRLNQSVHETTGDHRYRSQSSIRRKIAASNGKTPTLYERSGGLPTLYYLLKNPHLSNDSLAKELGITKRRLVSFYTRAGYTRNEDGLFYPRPHFKSDQKHHTVAVEKNTLTIEAFLKSVSTVNKSIPVSLKEVPLDPSEFSSESEMWLSLLSSAREKGILVNLSSIKKFQNPSPFFEIAREQNALEIIFNWMKKHEFKLPNESDFGEGVDQIPIAYLKLTGTSKWLYNHFESLSEFWMKLATYAQSQGHSLKLRDIKIIFPSTDFITKRRIEALEDSFNWMKTHDFILPKRVHFGEGEGQIPISFASLAGFNGALSIFPSYVEYINSLTAYANKNGSPKKLKSKNADELTLTVILDWMKDRGYSIPKKEHFGPGEAQIPISYSHLFGNDHNHKFFPDESTYLIRLYHAAKKNKITLNLTKRFIHLPSPELKLLFQENTLEIIIQWLIVNEWKFPQKEHFGQREGQIPLQYNRLVGNTAGNLIFDSYYDFTLKLIEAVKKYELKNDVTLKINLTLASTLNGDPKYKEVLQKNVLSLILDWIKKYHRIPHKNDFGFRENQIPINYQRISGAAKTINIFDSLSEFWIALYATAQTKKVFINLTEVTVPEGSETFKELVKRNALDIIFNWIIRNSGRTPKKADFGYGENQIPISYSKLTKTIGSNIFNSPSHFWATLFHEAKTYSVTLNTPISINLFLIDLINPTQDFLNALEQSAQEIILDWVIKNHGLYPEKKYFGDRDNQIPIPYHKLINYHGKGGLYQSVNEFKEIFETFSREKGVTLLASDEVVFHPDEIPLDVSQKDVLEIVLQWTLDHKNTPPKTDDFGIGGNKIPLNYFRLNGSEENAYFSSTSEFWIALSQYAKSKSPQIYINLARVNIKNPSETFKRERKEVIFDIVLNWIEAKKGIMPKVSDFGLNDPEQIPMRASLIFGFAEKGRIFESSEEFWLELNQAAKLRGKNSLINLSNVRVHASSDEFKSACQENALDIIFNWMETQNEGRFPKKSDFNFRENGIPISYLKLIKTRPDSNATFESREELNELIKNRIKKMIQNWSLENENRIPVASDFGVPEINHEKESNIIPLNYEQLFLQTSPQPASQRETIIQPPFKDEEELKSDI